MPAKKRVTEDSTTTPPKRRTAAPRRKKAESVMNEVRADASAGLELPVSAEDKRRMIMAHAVMRPTRDPVQLMSMWAGVMVAVMAVGLGWWWSVGASIAQTWSSGTVSKTFNAFAPDTQTQSQMQRELEQTSQRLDAMRAQAAAEQDQLNVLQPSATSTSNGRPGIFAPPPNDTSGTTVTTTLPSTQ